ncbi:acyl-CoA synthetase [Phaeobacter sp. 22II1-1F12B]|uniref:acyl-CoA synthetase n=1 Tax=Phaeobacter sp. 22II1-1F12B TaxID=1317111 RepID=UPI000B52768E|nr:acyl-CoA synthetase [Phaeobacter sp. 22II1-1F12B]OWU82410.1 acyl-CoA synthetase [Phaeobacter sp. 22II1-1F12B]
MSGQPWPSSTRVPNVAYFLTKNAKRQPDAVATVYDGQTWTWGQFDARVSALAHSLRHDLGLSKGDAVLVQSANNNQMLEIMMAVFRAGLIWAPANFRQGTEEIAYQCRKSRARAMFVEQGFPGHAAACEGLVDHVIAIGELPGAHDYEDLINRNLGKTFVDEDVSRDDACWLFFTSGSTGRPKAVVLTHGQMTFTILNHMNDLMPGLSPRDASLVVAPLSHGAAAHAMAQIAAGAKSVILPQGRFDPAHAWQMVEEWRVSNMFTVPTIVKILVEDPSVEKFDHTSLRHVIYAGAPMYRADQKRALRALGPVLVQYYGLGEVTGAITVLRPEDHFLEDSPEARPGTCGVERTGLQVTIQDDSGAICAPNETGEICVIGTAVFPGYFDDDGANAKSFRNGWFRTGDLGHMDEQGYIFITGRSSDMYISGGSNVYPREIEEILLTVDGVSEVAILGIPDPRWGEVGLCVCVPEPGATLTEDAIRSCLDGKVAKYKIPRDIVFLDEMPKTAYGKITKKLVREVLTERGLIPSDQPEEA